MNTATVVYKPVTIGEGMVYFQTGVPIAAQRGLAAAPPVPAVSISNREVGYLVAHVLQQRLAQGSVKTVARVGRFLKVQYIPLSQADPTMIVTTIPGAVMFHRAMRRFMESTRRHSYAYGGYGEPAQYQAIKNAGRGVVGPLARLRPTVAEAEFVICFLLNGLTYGE